MNYVVRDPLKLTTEALLQSTGVDGVFARTGVFERVVEGLNGLISRHRDVDAEVLRFPPVMSRAQIQRSGYLGSFPNLLGAVCCLGGAEAEIRAAVEGDKAKGAWTGSLAATDLVLTPAACYPLYPMIAARGRVPAEGLVFDVASDCFRHEPSRQIDRLQTFRMREFVRVGSPEQAASFRAEWLARAPEIADLFGLSYRVAPASDPFFGRAGRLMAINQVEQSLKFELLLPVRSAQQPTACMSFNDHRDHFGKTWEIATADGATAHTCCVAFGIDRLTLALFAAHGLDLRMWPASAREALGL
ncbi:MAG TPA: amino acid--[acyl-carrier-protein] ligase [Xanthobacteraceae bacterium]|nr:amino acid--[acyl-carrier-protein] ligase [Xanthobacteraceae bacterium]